MMVRIKIDFTKLRLMIIAVTIQQMSFDLVEEVAFCFLILQEVMKQ